MTAENSKNILFADDDESMHLFLKKFFEQYGINCDEAYDGNEAVNFVQKNPDKYKFILLDLNMPGLDGAKACVQIKEILKQSNLRIPVIALSSDLSVEKADEMLELGFDEYLEKPMYPDEFKNMISRYLDS